MEKIITRVDELPRILQASVTNDERNYLENMKKQSILPFGVTKHFASLACPEQNDPVRRQFFPNPEEEKHDPFALDDPLGEALHRKAPRLVHQYRDRVLLLASGNCASYCRYCFRRLWIGRQQAFITDEELIPVLDYLEKHDEIHEALISGGDPLCAENGELDILCGKLRKARPGLLLRICTRVPITAPDRFTPELISLFKNYRPLRIMAHINHPKELSEKAKNALSSCVNEGIPVHVQTVLLRGVNDNSEILAELFRACLNAGLSPYYLLQLDLAQGISHFRVPLKQGLSLYNELKTRISGLALPKYALDLPGGGGKVLLNEGIIAGKREEAGGAVWLLRGFDSKVWSYPMDD